MLQTYLDDQEWDLSAFVDLILAQTTVGSVVKIEDDEDEGLFALVTALNLYRYRVTGNSRSLMYLSVLLCDWFSNSNSFFSCFVNTFAA